MSMSMSNCPLTVLAGTDCEGNVLVEAATGLFVDVEEFEDDILS